MKGSQIKRIFKKNKLKIYVEPYTYSRLKYFSCTTDYGYYAWEDYTYTDEDDEEDDDIIVEFSRDIIDNKILFERLKDLRKHIEEHTKQVEDK